MARGDSISINDTTIGSNAAVVFGPASGVQWNIKFMTASHSGPSLTTAGGDELNCAPWAGETTETAPGSSVTRYASRINWVITNSQKMRIYNTYAGNQTYSYYGTDMGSDPSGVGSVISQTALSIASGGVTALQPASGQEWFLFWWAAKVGAAAMFRWKDTNDQLRWDLEASNTGHVATYGLGSALTKVRLHLTNSVYIKVYNSHSSTNYYVYNGIRTK